MLTNLINPEFEPRNEHFDLGLAADEVILVPLESHVQRIQVSKDVGKIAYPGRNGSSYNAVLVQNVVTRMLQILILQISCLKRMP